MNLLAIRTQFVEKSGRYDLVVDTTSYVDDGANFFIQAGQRLLDSILPNRKDIGRYHKAINANQSSITLKHIRAFDSVYVKASGSERELLDRKPYSWLLEQYGSDYGEKATGLATFSAVAVADDTVVIDTETWTFKAAAASTYQVTIGATVSATIDNLVTKINANSAMATAEKYSATEMLVEYYLVGTNFYGCIDEVLIQLVVGELESAGVDNEDIFCVGNDVLDLYTYIASDASFDAA